MRAQIEEKLDHIEAEASVRILYAVEAGSRAWDFASPDSDFDVRFIYAQTARDYIRVNPERDVIELPIENNLDINGWDVVKALTLFRKSNPPLLEWLFSPIVYREQGDFAARLREMARSQSSLRRMAYHYVSMARQTFKAGIEGREQVVLKKYLYVLRPLLCIRWMEQFGSPAPTSLPETLAAIEIEGAVREAIFALMARKRQSGEMGADAPIALLSDFARDEMARLEATVAGMADARLDAEPVNKLLWDAIGV